jgi:pyridoxal phosphate enzyme (YggS family)
MSLESVKERIALAAQAAGRAPDSVTLVVVTKERTKEQIEQLYRLGHRHFGENRAQELAAKVGQLPDDIVWHFIGPLQTNKVRIVRPIVRLLHSLDRDDLIPAWVKGPGSPPGALIQVRIGGEESKHGVEPTDAVSFAEKAALAGIDVQGVMAIPPAVSEPRLATPFFLELATIGADLARVLPGATELSMGMSDDFEAAVAAGATIVRVGRAIFEPVPN